LRHLFVICLGLKSKRAFLEDFVGGARVFDLEVDVKRLVGLILFLNYL